MFMGVAQILLDNLDLSHIVSVATISTNYNALCSGDWLVQAVRHILVGGSAPRRREGGPSVASFASGASTYQPHPPSSPRARQDEALTPLLLLLLPPHPPHQNHHFPYFHCISSHHSRLRIPRAGTNGSKKDFGRLSPANGGRRLAKFIFTKLFIFTDQYILQH